MSLRELTAKCQFNLFRASKKRVLRYRLITSNHSFAVGRQKNWIQSRFGFFLMLYHAQTWSGTDLKDLQALIFFHLSIFFYPLLLLAFTSYNPDPDPIWKICRHLQFICILCPCFLNYIFFILFFLVPVSLNCISVTRALQKWKKEKRKFSFI